MSVSITAQETLASPPPSVQGKTQLEKLRRSYNLQQQPVRLTLDGLSIFLTALALVLLIHFLEPRQAEVLVCLAPVVVLVQNDYRNFLNLGPGGTPSTFPGYLKITWYRIWALRDPFTAPRTTFPQLPKTGILRQRSLPYRAGPRPVVVGIAPQRQLNQFSSKHCAQALRLSMTKLAGKSPKQFGTETSCVEKHGMALYARHPVRTSCQGEICHVHDSDNAMHMCLHPDDIREVLAKGWGQRHPLAWKGHFLKSPVSEEFVMIYTPRDAEELQVICSIIESAIWHSTGKEVEMSIYLNPSEA